MDTNAIYLIGNGRMAAAFCKGELRQLFGPPYSAPSLFTCEFAQKDAFAFEQPFHLPQCAVWTQTLQCEGRVLASVTDFALVHENCLVRRVQSQMPITLRLCPEPADGSAFQYAVKDSCGGTPYLLLKTKTGNPLYNDYPLPFPQYYALVVRGDASITEQGSFAWNITVSGTADLLFIGGPSYPECMDSLQRLVNEPYETMLQKTADWWHSQFDACAILKQIPQDMPFSSRIRQAAEDTVLNILTQQSAEGGVLAGYQYHLGYVRDQYGVCMAMLKLGLYQQARQMLCFYSNVFHHSGKILNAQAMGIPDRFHYAENDAAEITGYLLLQFFRYAEITGDWTLLQENTDFLLWLYEQQEGQLLHDMIPFNGDETYIAGYLLPRDVIYDGSAEATLLFLLSGEALTAYLQKHPEAGTDAQRIAQMQETLQKVQDHYAENFVLDGRYAVNNPARTKGEQLPEYRYGVCMNFRDGEYLYSEDCDVFGWTKLCPGGVYLCPKCCARGKYPEKVTEIFHLPSALLMPAYLGRCLVDEQLILDYLKKLTDQLEKEGVVYSDEKKQKNVGYDYGLLLYNLVKFDLPGKEAAAEKLLSLLDEAGSWSEYYVRDRHAGNRYRPWESGINIDALLTWAEWYRQK